MGIWRVRCNGALCKQDVQDDLLIETAAVRVFVLIVAGRAACAE